MDDLGVVKGKNTGHCELLKNVDSDLLQWQIFLMIVFGKLFSSWYSIFLSRKDIPSKGLKPKKWDKNEMSSAQESQLPKAGIDNIDVRF